MSSTPLSGWLRFIVGASFLASVLGLAGLAILRFGHSAQPLAPVLAALGALLAAAGLPLLAKVWWCRPPRAERP
jgi:hypothetical protein